MEEHKGSARWVLMLHVVTLAGRLHELDRVVPVVLTEGKDSPEGVTAKALLDIFQHSACQANGVMVTVQGDCIFVDCFVELLHIVLCTLRVPVLELLLCCTRHSAVKGHPCARTLKHVCAGECAELTALLRCTDVRTCRVRTACWPDRLPRATRSRNMLHVLADGKTQNTNIMQAPDGHRPQRPHTRADGEVQRGRGARKLQ